MKKNVVLIAFQDQGNLGVGYLASSLMSNGFSVRHIDFRQAKYEIVNIIRDTDPLLLGFSLIFQYYLPQVANLASFLREQGIRCHFSIGGHFPSLEFAYLLDSVPEIDSVVLFEGELTLVQLAEKIQDEKEWREISGIAFRQKGGYTHTEYRPLIDNLDELPFPARPFPPETVLGRKALPVLASRGCARGCSFCSIRQFYGTPPGKLVRRRSPREVVREMRLLFDSQEVTVFLFQDDDFPIQGKTGKTWVSEFISALHESGLVQHIVWKISCRADEVEPELFTTLQNAGLYLVYLGLESGSESGLKTLNKQISVEANYRAVSTLKSLGLLFEYGFMLFDPASSFKSIRENVSFLRRIAEDGRVAAVYCKMLPYAGTPIMQKLKAEGRVKGDVSAPDYAFTDTRVEHLFSFLQSVTRPWFTGDSPLSHDINWSWHEVAIIDRLTTDMARFHYYQKELCRITREANDLLFKTIEVSCRAFEQDTEPDISVQQTSDQCKQLHAAMLDARNDFVLLNREVLLQDMRA